MHVHFEPAGLKVQYMHIINWDICFCFVSAKVLLTIRVVKIMANLQINADSPEDAELARFTPSFLWLLRDFYLTLEEDGRKVSSTWIVGLMRLLDCGMRPDPCREGTGVPCIFKKFYKSRFQRWRIFGPCKCPDAILKDFASEGILPTAKIYQMLQGPVDCESIHSSRSCCAYPTRSTDNKQYCPSAEGGVGMQLTPREYLEQALKAVEGSGRSVQQKNQVSTPCGPGTALPAWHHTQRSDHGEHACSADEAWLIADRIVQFS